MYEMRTISDDEQGLLTETAPPPEQPSKNTAPSPPSINHPAQVRARGQRYWLRTLVLIFSPLIVVVYFCVICYWVMQDGSDSAVKFGRPGGRYIFYSWFIIGVIGLDLSRYGLLGVEAAMLESPRWEAPNLVALLQHSNNTWSSPSGWFRWLFKVLKHRRRDTHRLWYLLSTLTVTFFVALPLSGLALEQSDGYIHASGRPKVIGRRRDDFHLKDSADFYPDALNAWQIGSPPLLPGFGVLYTPKSLDREKHDCLKQVPNTLPLNESISEIFLAPQAKSPVAGRAWGIKASYHCDVVSHVSNLTLLNPSVTSEAWEGFYGHADLPGMGKDGRGIGDYYEDKTGKSRNVVAYGQVGFGTKSGIYNGSEETSFEAQDMNNWDVIEYVLWQYRTKAAYEEVADFSSELDPVIEGLDSRPIIQAKNGTFVRNTTFFSELARIQRAIDPDKAGGPGGDGGPFKYPSNIEQSFLDMAKPIGVRCRMISTVGYANIDPWSSSWNSFEQADPSSRVNITGEGFIPSLGNIAATVLLQGRYIKIYTSVNRPGTKIQSNSQAYQGYIKPKDLQRSVMQAYAVDALQLMYDGKYDFDIGLEHPNLTTSTAAKVLTAGELPVIVILVPLCIWAVGCIVLGVAYGFRRRQNETMDGYAYFRLSTDLADDVKPLVGSLMGKKPDQIDALWKLPGSIVRNTNRS